MKTTKLPGTTIDAHIEYNCADKIFTPMFYSGGLVLSQVVQITGLEGYIIQNWVKRKYLPHPENKKYTRQQLCRILNINVLKDCFTLDQADDILGYVSRSLKGGSQSFDDNDLYAYFTNTLAALKSESKNGESAKDIDMVISELISDKRLSSKASEQRLSVILKIMVTAYESLQVKNDAVGLFQKLDFK